MLLAHALTPLPGNRTRIQPL